MHQWSRVEVVDPAGASTRQDYDEFLRLVRQVDALGGTSTWEHDDTGALVRQSTRAAP